MAEEINRKQTENTLGFSSAQAAGDASGAAVPVGSPLAKRASGKSDRGDRILLRPFRSVALRLKKMAAFFDPKFTSLYIDDTGLKLMVVKGKRVMKWAEMPLESGTVNDGVIARPEIVAAGIKRLCREQRIKDKKIITGFSGVHCISRIITLPVISYNLLEEAVLHEAGRELPVPLDNLYVAWQIIQTTKEEMKIFLIAYTRSTVDSLVGTLKKTGIKPHLMDLAPLAITRIIDKTTAAVVDIRPAGMDIVILIEGIPEVIRSLPLPSDKSWQDKLPIIVEELERTFNFYDSGRTKKTLRENLPVYISGIPQNEPEIYQSLSDQLDLPVREPLPPLIYPAGIEANKYMVNIGLIFKKPYFERHAGLSLINVNALPQIYRPRAINTGKALTALGSVAAVGAIVAMSLLVYEMNRQTESLRNTFLTANQALVQKQALQKNLNASIAGLEKSVAETTQTSAVLNAELTGLHSQQDILNTDLALVTFNLMDSMTLNSIRHTGNTLVISGTAPSEAEILSYSDNLFSTGRYPEIIFSRIAQKTGAAAGNAGAETRNSSMEFTLNLKIRE